MAEMSLEFIKKTYVKNWGACECGSKEFDFEKAGQVVGLTTYNVICKGCGKKKVTTGIINSRR